MVGKPNQTILKECQTARTQDDSDSKFPGRLRPKPFRTQDESHRNLFGTLTTNNIINVCYPWDREGRDTNDWCIT